MFATLLDDPGEINRQLERYLAVTRADVRSISAELLAPHNRAVLTYVPAAGVAAEEEGDGADEGAGDGGPLADGTTEARA
jgi:hypothetical protein